MNVTIIVDLIFGLNEIIKIALVDKSKEKLC